MPNDFSFAPHENDPADIAKNPWKHHASAAAGGGATGAAIGTALGAWAGAGKGFKSMLGHAGAGALFGGGLGTGLGYHKSEKKQRTVEQAYGANDPFAMDKLSYDQAHDAGRQFAWRMLREKAGAASPQDAFKDAAQKVVQQFDYSQLLHPDDLWDRSIHSFPQLASQGSLRAPHWLIDRHIEDIEIARQKGRQAEQAADGVARAVIARHHNEDLLVHHFANKPFPHTIQKQIIQEILKQHATLPAPKRPTTADPSLTTARTSGPTQAAGATPPPPNPGAPSPSPSASASPSPNPTASQPPNAGAPTTHGANRPPRTAPAPVAQKTISEAATDLWTNHKGKLGLGAAALGLSGLGYYAYMENQRRNAEQLFQPREDVPGA